MKFRWFLMTCAAAFAQSAKGARWPPAWFGAGRGRTSDVAARSEELLEDGFGRSA
jgi:hypothetical protein